MKFFTRYFSPHLVRVFCVTVLIVSLACYANGRVLKGKLLFTDENNWIYLSEVIGIDSYLIDSIQLDSSRKFSFDVSGLPTGFYHLGLSDTNAIDIIFNQENIIEINFHEPLLREGVEVLHSKENKLLWEYKYYSRKLFLTQKKLMIQKSYQPEGDSLWDQYEQKIDSLEQERKYFLDQIVNKNQNSFFAKVVGASLPPALKEGQTMKENYFQNTDFSDPALIRSSIFPASIIEYLQRHTEFDEEGFQRSVDHILSLAADNEEVYEYSLNYLLDVFNKVGPQVVFQYLVETYLIQDGCADIAVSEKLENLTESYRKLMPGNRGPDFALPDTAGKEFRLTEIISRKPLTVIFFWSSGCAHCHEVMSDLKSLHMKKQKELQIVSVSLDTSVQAWKDYIQKENLNWLNLSELKGWDSEISEIYKVHKTPWFFLLDQNAVILSRSSSITEINRSIMDL